MEGEDREGREWVGGEEELGGLLLRDGDGNGRERGNEGREGREEGEGREKEPALPIKVVPAPMQPSRISFVEMRANDVWRVCRSRSSRCRV